MLNDDFFLRVLPVELGFSHSLQQMFQNPGHRALDTMPTAGEGRMQATLQTQRSRPGCSPVFLWTLVI
jgi:hypothetical protein